VTDSTDATLSGQATTNVVAPDVATQLVLRLPESVPTGVAVTVQLVALDAHEHLVSDYSGTVSVANSDTAATCRPVSRSRTATPPSRSPSPRPAAQTLTVTDSADATLTGQAATNVVGAGCSHAIRCELPQNVPAGWR